MKQINLFLHTIVKCIEIFYNFIFAGSIVMLSIQLLEEYEYVTGKVDCDSPENECLKSYPTFLGLSVPFMILHILHQNICSNMRLRARTQAPVCCYLCWDPLNILICKCGKMDQMQKSVCRDKCCLP